MQKYLDSCRELSLTARAAISLIVFTNFCENRGLKSSFLDEFFDYMWQWPLIDGADQFIPWESDRACLVNCGFGDEFPNDFINYLNSKDIDQDNFREILSHSIEILWSSFWGEAENDRSISALAKVLRLSNQPLPPLTPFKFSRFKDNGGWGNKITENDCQYWRSCFSLKNA